MVWVGLVWFWSALLGILIILGGCNQKEDPKPGPPAQPVVLTKAKVFVTSGDQSQLLSQSEIAVTVSKDQPSLVIDSTVLFQEIEGFGASLTGSSAYLINKKLNASQRNTLLQELFDDETGIGISYLRMTIGASDFSLSDYTYNDLPSGQTDPDLNNFSIQPDKQDVIPVLKNILTISPDLKIMGSPWSAPAWMKTNGSLKGGELKTEYYETYANYFVKYIDAFANEGIRIDAITPQNEPLYFTAGYPCMNMTADEQRLFIADHLGPAFVNAGIDTKIIIYDHNWDNTQYAISILGDAAASNYVSGSAFHAYAGEVSAMSTVHNAFPSKGIYFTEISGGEWATNFSDNLAWNMNNIFIGGTQHWAKTVLLWNLALDENHGPKNNGCQDCRGVVTINSTNGTITRNVEYYSIAHFSKFVKPGAYRISSSLNGLSDFKQVAFLNPDGSKVLVVYNNASASQTFIVKLRERQFQYTTGARTLATIVWN